MSDWCLKCVEADADADAPVVKSKGLRLRKNCSTMPSSVGVLKQNTTGAHFPKRVVFHERLVFSFMTSYKALCSQVEELREEQYDSERYAHQRKLLELWRLMKPDEDISLCYGNHWRKIGFQSDDPSRDFRGMGILSLEQLLYMARFHSRIMRSILISSNHPKVGFPFAITGINITSLCHHLLKEGLLVNHFRNTTRGVITIEEFHEGYCHIFYLFTEFWKKTDPPSLLNFNSVRMNFETALIPLLKNESCQLESIVI